jgi:drug/metabolite transporter (DMT)-like permease
MPPNSHRMITEQLSPYLCTLNHFKMFFLLIALFFSSCIFIVFKLFNRFNISILPAVTTNYLVALSFGYFSCCKDISLTQVFLQPWVLIAGAAGATFILTFLVFAVSTQRVGVAMTVVSGKMSIVLSAAVGFLILYEPFSVTKMIGIMAALAAFFLTNLGRSEVNVERKYLYLPALIFFGTGANDILMKLSGVYYAERNDIQFLTVAFLSAFTIGFIILIYQAIRNSMKISWKEIAAGILLGALNWYSTYFFIRGLNILPISLFIPVFNAALVFIAAAVGYLIFREKLSLLNRIGIFLALLAIAVIAFS